MCDSSTLMVGQCIENVDSVQGRIFKHESLLEWTGQWGSKILIRLLPRRGKLAHSQGGLPRWKFLPLKSVIILINHFVGYIIYIILSQFEKKITCQKDSLYCIVHTINGGLTPVLLNFSSYQFSIQKLIRWFEYSYYLNHYHRDYRVVFF